MRLGIFIKIGIYLFHKNYSIFWREICVRSVKCDLDLSVEWFQLLFRKIKLTWSHKCVVRELARFIDRHVTRFSPIASTHFEMRYYKWSSYGRRHTGWVWATPRWSAARHHRLDVETPAYEMLPNLHSHVPLCQQLYFKHMLHFIKNYTSTTYSTLWTIILQTHAPL